MTDAQTHSLYRSDTHSVDHLRPAQPNGRGVVYLTFTAYTNLSLDGAGYAGNFLLASGFDVIAFKTVENDWFQHLPAVALESVLAYLGKSELGSWRRVGYGSSMGATAAIQFSAELGLDVVLAMSPQFSIDPEYELRWKQDFYRLRFQYPMQEACISPTCRYAILFDPHDADRQHFERYRELIPADQLVGIRIPGAGHPVNVYLHQIGLLKTVALLVARSLDFSGLDFRTGRRRSVRYLGWLAEKALRRGKKALAFRLADIAIGHDPTTRSRDDLQQAFLVKGQLLEAGGKAPEATEAYRQALATEPQSRHLRGELVHHLLRRGAAAAALVVLDEGIAIDANAANLHFDRSHVLHQLGRSDEAIVAAQRALELSPADINNFLHLSNLLKIRNRFAEALTCTEAALNLVADHPDARRQHALLLASNGRGQEAFDEVTSLVAQNPAEANLFEQLSHSLAEAGDAALGIDAIDHLIALSPDTASYHLHRSHLLGRLQQHDQAIDAARRARELEPSSVDIDIHLSNLWVNADSLEEAQKSIDQSVQQKPDAAMLRWQQSLILDRQRRREDAIDALRGALQLDRSQSTWHQRLAQWLIDADDWAGALSATDAAIELEGDSDALQRQRISIVRRSGPRPAPALTVWARC